MAPGRAYGVVCVPTTFVIAPNGRVASRFDGYALAARVDQAIQAFVGGPLNVHPATPKPKASARKH
jgi:hypothetical protein